MKSKHLGSSLEAFLIDEGIYDQVSSAALNHIQEIYVTTLQEALTEYHKLQQTYWSALVSLVHNGTIKAFDVWGFAYGDRRKLASIYFNLECL